MESILALAGSHYIFLTVSSFFSYCKMEFFSLACAFEYHLRKCHSAKEVSKLMRFAVYQDSFFRKYLNKADRFIYFKFEEQTVETTTVFSYKVSSSDSKSVFSLSPAARIPGNESVRPPTWICRFSTTWSRSRIRTVSRVWRCQRSQNKKSDWVDPVDLSEEQTQRARDNRPAGNHGRKDRASYQKTN